MQTILLLVAVVKLCSASDIFSERLKGSPKNFNESSKDNSVFDKILAINEKSERRHPGRKSKFFEGDIVLTKSAKELIENRKRGAASRYKSHLWPLKNGKREIPYRIDPGVYRPHLILKAMKDWMEKVPCLSFVPRSNQRGYIEFYRGKYCSSQVGYRGYQQQISLAKGCMHHGTILHEIGHALGFWHEQSRSDRDQYVTIHTHNIQPNRLDNFVKKTPSETDDRSHGYDYDSIMHYGPKAFSKNGWDTITAKNGHSIGQRQELSAIDIAQMKTMYAPCEINWFRNMKFAPKYLISADGYNNLGSRFVDLNGDGRMDQVYNRWINPQRSLKGAYLSVAGKGFVSAQQFIPPVTIGGNGYMDLGKRFVDLNGDKKVDLVFHRYINMKTREKGAYLNNGNGWTWAPQYTPPYYIAADGYGDVGIRFIELNGDGKIDMVYHRWLKSNWQMKGAYLNNGNGWTYAPAFIPPYPIAADGYRDMGSRFVDLNADGRMDMVYHRYVNSRQRLKGAYLNDGNTWVSAPQYIPPYTIAGDRYGDLGARFVDLNNDGRMDMVYYRWHSDSYQLKGAYINNGKGWTFSAAYTPPFRIAADGHRDLGARFADVTGDGLVDFIYYRWINNKIQEKGAYINTGRGWRYDAQYIPPYQIAADNYKDMGSRFVDVNGDGAADFVYNRYTKWGATYVGAYLSCGDDYGATCSRSSLCRSSPDVRKKCKKTCSSCPT